MYHDLIINYLKIKKSEKTAESIIEKAKKENLRVETLSFLR